MKESEYQRKELLEKLMYLALVAEAHGEVAEDNQISFIAKSIEIVIDAGLENGTATALHHYIQKYLYECALVSGELTLQKFLVKMNPICLN